jgi:hypothetical protein
MKSHAIALTLLGLFSLCPVHPAASQETAPRDSASATDQTPDLAGRLDGMTEQVQTLTSDVDKLKKIKITGYIQVRWETAENKSDSVRVASDPNTRDLALTPANNERFYIRRGRLKVTYDSSPLSQAVIYFDGGQDRTIRLLEAYVTLLDPWTVRHAHALTAGQMNVPFGYEIERSSSVRELPERSRAENVLFPGERDRGVKIVSQWTPQLETVVGAYNGGGINHPNFPTTDPTKDKDVVGRIRYSQGTIDAAVSYYDGHNLTALTGPDVETDKTRFGADAQFFYEAPMVGGGSLKGEYYSGKESNPDTIRVYTTTVRDPVTGAATARLLKADAPTNHFATDFVGWYVMWVQNIRDHVQLAARYDAYDPNTDAGHDQFQRVSLGVNYFYDGFTRLTVAYDIPRTSARDATSGAFVDPKDNLLTVQLQHKF